MYFCWKDYADHHRKKVMKLSGIEFIRHFLMHVLPPGFMRIRHFGFLANCIRQRHIECLRRLFALAGSRMKPVQPTQGYNMTIIGQIRINTALYKRPRQKKARGRPRKYGTKYTRTEIKHLKLNNEQLKLYGRNQKVNYRTAVAKARFLDGQFVRFVYCEFEDDKGKKRPRLLLSTDTKLTGLEVIVAYEKRWCIEAMFNPLKNAWNMKQA